MLSSRSVSGLVCTVVCLAACAPVPAHRSSVSQADADGDGGAGGDMGTGGAGGAAGGSGGGTPDAEPIAGSGGSPADAAADLPVPVDSTPTAPPGAPTVMVTAGDGQVMLSWAAVAGATSYTVKRGTAVGGPYTALAPQITATSYVDPTVMNGTAYYYEVSASNAAGETNSAAVPATPVAGWTSQDIGAATPAGSTVQNGNSFTVGGGPGDIYNTADVLRFVFQSVTGDATIIAHVVSVQNVDAFSKAGVMMRAGVDPGAINITALTTPTAANGHRLQSRATAGATTLQDKTSSGNAPIWFRLVRRGNVFTGSTSPNGTTWTALGTAKTITMPAAIDVGLAVSSHVVNMAGSAVFDNVSITKP
jgi:hypothetical protein